MFNNTYRNKSVLITGHTGFKGSWLALWLLKLNARVVGYALEPPSQPSHYPLLALDMESILGDIRDKEKLRKAIDGCKPDIVFHLAAQPLVRKSYEDPTGTFETNVMGTLNVLEVCRRSDTLKAIVNITSDKCYENREWPWGYRENDPMGGHDPYSASKGCAELLTTSYQRSFFPIDTFGKDHQTLVASVRAGNIVGGGDWGEDRLIPDIVRAASRHQPVIIRNPRAVRPWQHVLDPLAGYLMVGQRLLEGQKDISGPWNFGPGDGDQKEVLCVVQAMQQHWAAIEFDISANDDSPHEAGLLRLDCSKARIRLKWRPIWDGSQVFEKTARWYRQFYEDDQIISREHLNEYISDAGQKQISWTAE